MIMTATVKAPTSNNSIQSPILALVVAELTFAPIAAIEAEGVAGSFKNPRVESDDSVIEEVERSSVTSNTD